MTAHNHSFSQISSYMTLHPIPSKCQIYEEIVPNLFVIKNVKNIQLGAGMPYEEHGGGVRPGDVRLVPLRQEDASQGVLSLQPLR